jgi:hypothetical protein
MNGKTRDEMLTRTGDRTTRVNVAGMVDGIGHVGGLRKEI